MELNCLKKVIMLSKNDALIVTDVQFDFLPGGSLAVPEGDQIIPALNEYISLFANENLPVFATRDWHPKNHISFKQQGGPWPPHCIQNTEGAKFPRSLKVPGNVIVVSKATNLEKEAYSSFDGTQLTEQLKASGVSRIFIGGLTTEYCVKYTVLDGLKAGFNLVLLSDAIRGLNANKGDLENAIQEMVQHGAEQAELTDFPDPRINLPPIEPGTEKPADEPLIRAENRKKTRMRSRGPYRKIRSER